MQKIRRLLVVEGYTCDEIMQLLGLSYRTFYRYNLSAVFSHDRQLLAEKISDEDMLNQIAILHDRLSKQRRDLQLMANDKMLTIMLESTHTT